MSLAYIYIDMARKNFFNYVKKKKINDSYIFEITNTKVKTIKKIENKLKEYKIKKIVCTEEIDDLLFNDYYKITGKNLMNYMLYDILKYIFDIQNVKMELNDIYFLIKNDDEKYIQNIKMLSYYFKSINIITDDIQKFQKIADTVSKENECLIYITSNKVKSLLRAKYIINFDLNNEEIEKYNINRKGIIINIKNNIRIKNNLFDGIVINSVEIDFNEEIKKYFDNLMNIFNTSQLYESILNQKQELEQIRKRIKEDGVNILYLNGNNGEICEEELVKLLDKTKKLV